MSPRTVPRIRRSDWESFFGAAALMPSMRHGGTQLPTEFPRSDLSAAFAAFEPQLAAYREERAEFRRRTAPDFNVFDFIKPTENVLSDILKFFLEPTESHGQGDFFLHRMIRRTHPDLPVSCQGARVTREGPTYSLPIPKNRRRIDVVATLGDFLLGIENKKFTGEGTDQIQDYCQHLKNIAARRPFCLIFLSRTGAEAASIAPELASGYKRNNQLKNWSWERDIPAWLHECHTHCKSDKIRHFIDDFRGYIARYLATQQNSIENNDNE